MSAPGAPEPRSSHLSVHLDGADFARLVLDQGPWAGTRASATSRVAPVDRRSLSDRYRSWSFVYRLGGNWTNVVLARAYLDRLGAHHEIVFDNTLAASGYAILTDYRDLSCGTCPWRPSAAAQEPPAELRCHSEPITCSDMYRRQERVFTDTLDEHRATDSRREDGSPDANVVIEFMHGLANTLWWRLPDDMWTNGCGAALPWEDVELERCGFAAVRPITNAQALLYTAVVERDSMAQALLAHDLERWYRTGGWPDPRQMALALIAELRPDLEPCGATGTLRVALSLSTAQVLDALATPSREPAPQHLWEVKHPYYGAQSADDDTECASFDELKTFVNRHDHDGSTVIYRWDWIDSSSPLLDGPDADNPGPDEFQIYGLFVRGGQLFSLRCPITKDQEGDVLAWLRGPRMLGALRRLWAPLLDPTTATTEAQP